MRHLLLALALSLSALLPGLAAAQGNDTSNPIVARMAAFVAAYNAADADAIAAIYAEDAALLLPGEASILGREAIAAHYARAFEGGVRDLQWMTFDIRATEFSAVEIGETVFHVGEQRIVGRYMHLWEVVDGQILLARDMFQVLRAE